jgi:hypothetical protein
VLQAATVIPLVSASACISWTGMACATPPHTFPLEARHPGSGYVTCTCTCTDTWYLVSSSAPVFGDTPSRKRSKPIFIELPKDQRGFYTPLSARGDLPGYVILHRNIGVNTWNTTNNQQWILPQPRNPGEKVQDPSLPNPRLGALLTHNVQRIIRPILPHHPPPRRLLPSPLHPRRP